MKIEAIRETTIKLDNWGQKYLPGFIYWPFSFLGNLSMFLLYVLIIICIGLGSVALGIFATPATLKRYNQFWWS